jgi:hypothetical protein
MKRKMSAWFETLVVGVVAPTAVGVVRSCVECRRSDRDPASCTGFGPGCLAHPQPAKRSQER